MEILLSLAAIVLSIIALSRSGDSLLKIERLEKLLSSTKNTSKTAGLDLNVISPEDGEEIDTETQNEEELEDDNAGDTYDDENKEDSYTTVPYEEPAFVTWLKEDWLLKLGGTLVLMGVLFFLSLAYTAVGPQGKVSIGYIFGAALMVFGFKYMKKNVVGGSSIHVVGAVVILITTYLARQPDYNLFNPYLATLLMFLTTVCVALTAYVYERTELAHVGLLLALVVPMLTNTESSNFTQLLLYLGVVTLGTLWLALVTKWRTLVILALGALCMYSLVRIGGSSTLITFTESYLLVVFGILFYVTSLFSILRSKGVTHPADGGVALLNAAYALVWIFSSVTNISHEFAPIVLAIIALIYAVGFFFVYKVTNVYTSFIVYGGVSLGLVTTSVMMELSGRSETMVLLLMGAGITLFTYYLSENEEITKITAFFNCIPALFVGRSVIKIQEAVGNPSLYNDVWKDLIVVGFAMVIYFAVYAYFARRLKSLSYVALAAGIILVVVSIFEVSQLVIGGRFSVSLAFLISSVGLTLFAYHFSKDDNITQNVALITIVNLFLGLASVSVIESAGQGVYSTEIWKDWIFVVLLMSTAFSLYFYFIRKIKNIAYCGFWVGLLFVVTSIWQVLHHVIPLISPNFADGIATFLSILIYTVVGLIVLFQGTQQQHETKMKLSRVWLGFLAARVIFWDAWHTGNNTVGVLICIVIGILLLSSTFIIKNMTKK